jgi:hypothetical protein
MTSPPPTSQCTRLNRKNMMRAVSEVSSDDSCHQTVGDNKQQPQRKVSRVSPPPATRKLVTFNNSVRVSRTLHINSYSHVEIDACWYSQQEYNTIGDSARRVANLSEHDDEEELQVAQHHHYPEQQRRHDEEETEEFCFRGVECFTRRGSRRRLKNKMSGRNAVLFEQGLQWEGGVCWPEDIAKGYKLAASEARANAIRVAGKDQVHARLLLWCSI